MPEIEHEIDEQIAELRSMIDSLRETQRRHTAAIVNLQDENAELRAWMERMPKSKIKRKPIKFIRDFPAFDTLTQIKAQLFHNPPNTSGKPGGTRQPKWNLKVGFWTLPLNDATLDEYPDGTVKPCFFPMYALPHAFKLMQDQTGAQSLLATTIEAGTPCELIGARKLTEYNLFNGKLDGDQVALMAEDGRLLLGSQAWDLVHIMTNPNPITIHVDSKHAVKVWTWQPAASQLAL